MPPTIATGPWADFKVSAEMLAMGYGKCHRWLTKLLGKASDNMCQHCEERPAIDWAFDNANPFLTDQHSKQHEGKPYYPDPRRYVPLCRSCHRAYDKGVAPGRCEHGHLFDEANSYYEPGDPGNGRRCRKCKNKDSADRRRERKERKRLGLDEPGWLDGGLPEFVAGTTRVP